MKTNSFGLLVGMAILTRVVSAQSHSPETVIGGSKSNETSSAGVTDTFRRSRRYLAKLREPTP